MMKLVLSVVLLAVCAQSIDVVPTLNVTAYLGRWYQMYTDISSSIFEFKANCATADYGLLPGGNVSVYNSERRGTPTGPQDDIHGYAFIPDASQPAKLLVHFDVAPVDANYWVVALGKPTFTGDSICSPCYEYAVVSNPTETGLFVLARDPATYYSQYNQTVFDFLESHGFNKIYNSPILTPQTSDCIYPNPPS